MWCHTGLEEKQCDKCVATSLTLLMQKVLVTVVFGWVGGGIASAPPPLSGIFSVVFSS